MTELKRPERYLQPESIKPELKEVTEFYTRKVTDYQHHLKQLNEYADALENEISVLKEAPKVEVLLDNMAKRLVVIPRLVADFIESENHNGHNREGTLVFKHYNSYKGNGNCSELHEWIADNFDTFLEAIVNDYTVEKEQLYYLKNKLTNKYLLEHKVDLYFDEDELNEESSYWKTKFNQSEIDKLIIGSYEQIEIDEWIRYILNRFKNYTIADINLWKLGI